MYCNNNTHISKILILTLFLSNLSKCSNNRPTVTTPSGKIMGNYNKSFNSREFSSFEGIPYAKPPIEERRFEKPEPIDKWNVTLDASFLYTCPQVQPMTIEKILSGEEDCLYLNVYTPRKHPSPLDNLDVIVHIHGGGFMFESSHAYAHPGYLMDHDVVFVTFNYRLGILGFLSTEDDVVPGNMGLKDQVMALEWVRSHIASFGGNPNSVTLTGASAGAASVHLHYFSKLSRGLFHRGFIQSGCALNPWVIIKNASERTKKLALGVGCSSGNTEEMVECLRKADYQAILNQTFLLYEFKWQPVVLFGPVLEEKSSTAFISEDPYKLLKEEKVENVPLLVSFVPQEGGSLYSDFRNSTEELEPIWEDVAPILLYYENTTPKSRWGSVAKKIKNFYLGINSSFADKDSPEKFIKITTDRMFLSGYAEFATLQAATGSVYLYEMSYTGDYKNTVEHADDNQYFYNDQYPRKPTKNELEMKDILINMLVTYAKTGKPSIEMVEWKPVETNCLNFLNISGFETKDIQLRTCETLGNVEFWKSLAL